MKIEKAVNPRFEDFIFDWDYKQYLLVGGYGSSKSYHIALKIILKCVAENRKVLVVREVYETIRESCYDLFCEILNDLDLIEENPTARHSTKVICKQSPMQISFPNGSKIIFKGMDKPQKLKSINGISIVWLEEASEVKYDGYKEILGRLRHPTQSLHIFLSLNPVDKANWVYQHFFIREDPSGGEEEVVMDDERLYKYHTLVKNGVYYHHSTCDDNLFLPKSYLEELEDMQNYDPDLYRIAREGRFGINGIRVLPQFKVAQSEAEFDQMMSSATKFFNGMDFGFETSYNAIVRVAIDDKEKILYIYDEYYKNHMTDDKTSKELKRMGWDRIYIVADCAEPKTIAFYQQEGFRMRGCHKSAGSRLENTKKVKRFRQIICSPKCRNTIKELKNLTYKKDAKGHVIFDEFEIDPHTFSAIWYALDTYTVADIKFTQKNSKKGGSSGKKI